MASIVDITNASTEPFHRFHRFNEEFNRNIRIAVGALGVIALKKPTGSPRKVLRLPTLGEPWGKQTLCRDVAKKVPATKRFLSQVGIVRVFSAFEDLLIGARAEIHRNASLGAPDQQQEPSDGEDNSDLSVSGLYCQGRRKRGPLWRRKREPVDESEMGFRGRRGAGAQQKPAYLDPNLPPDQRAVDQSACRKRTLCRTSAAAPRSRAASPSMAATTRGV